MESLLIGAAQVMRHGVGLSTSSDSELIIQLLALTPPMEELDAPDWVARWVSMLQGFKLVRSAIIFLSESLIFVTSAVEE